MGCFFIVTVRRLLFNTFGVGVLRSGTFSTMAIGITDGYCC